MLFYIRTNLDGLEARLPPLVHGGEGTLQGLPGDTLTTACLAHQHGGVSGVFSLVKLDDFGQSKRDHLQTALSKLPHNNLLELKQISDSQSLNIQIIMTRCCILSMF